MENENKRRLKQTTWKKKIDFFFNILGWMVGLGNVWRFPYLCYQNGGGAFLVAYFSLVVVFIFPLILLESGLGQYTGHVVIGAWKVVPLYSGIGYASLMTKLYGLFYPVILAWALRWFLASFSNPLPWTTCGNPWNSDRCFVISNGTANMKANATRNTTMEQERSSSVEEYWRKNVLGMTSGLEDYGEMRWDLLGCLFICYMINYFSVWKGIRVTSKIIYLTSTIPLVMLIIVAVRGATLPGSWEGISMYLRTDIKKLGDIDVWKDATAQVLYSLGVCGGIFPTMSSYNNYRHNFLRDIVFVVIANCLVSLVSGFAIFSVLGYLAHQQNISVTDVAESGPGLVFVIYPTALSLLPLPQFWSALFFLMLLLLGLDSMFVAQEMMVACLRQMFPNFFGRRWGSELGLLILDIIGFLFCISMVTGGGIYVLQIANYYAATGWCMFFLALSELIAIGWLYGSDRMLDNIENMLGYKIPRIWFKICWKILTPLIAIVMMVYSCIQYRPLVYDRVYVYPTWANVIGWMMALSSLLLIPGFAIHAIWRAEGNTLKEKFQRVITPNHEGRGRVDNTRGKLIEGTEEDDKL